MQISMSSVFSFFEAVVPEIIGAAIGVYLGYLTALKLSQREQMNKKEAIIHSIFVEIRDNLDTLKKGLNKRIYYNHVNESIELLIHILSTDAFDSSVFSGSYQLLSVETQRRLTWFYKRCNIMNDLTNTIAVNDYLNKNRREIIEIKFSVRNLHEELLKNLKEVELQLVSESKKPQFYNVISQ
jgi:hypothetical protein